MGRGPTLRAGRLGHVFHLVKHRLRRRGCRGDVRIEPRADKICGCFGVALLFVFVVYVCYPEASVKAFGPLKVATQGQLPYKNREAKEMGVVWVLHE